MERYDVKYVEKVGDSSITIYFKTVDDLIKYCRKEDKQRKEHPQKDKSKNYINQYNYIELGLKEGDKIFVEYTNDKDFTDNTSYYITEIETDEIELRLYPDMPFTLDGVPVDFGQYIYNMFKARDDE